MRRLWGGSRVPVGRRLCFRNLTSVDLVESFGGAWPIALVRFGPPYLLAQSVGWARADQRGWPVNRWQRSAVAKRDVPPDNERRPTGERSPLAFRSHRAGGCG